MHTLLPGHSQSARSTQPGEDTHITFDGSLKHDGGVLTSRCLTAVVLVTVVVTVQVPVAALARQDAAA